MHCTTQTLSQAHLFPMKWTHVTVDLHLALAAAQSPVRPVCPGARTLQYKLVHISVGDLLRAEVAAGTPAGKRAQSFMDSGSLVPNEVRQSPTLTLDPFTQDLNSRCTPGLWPPVRSTAPMKSLKDACRPRCAKPPEPYFLNHGVLSIHGKYLDTGYPV